jgi:uncharacterized protein YcfJ
MTSAAAKLSLIAATTFSLSAVQAHAYEAVATVESVTPTREIINEPYQTCSTEYQQTTVPVAPPPYEDHSVAGAVVGGITGGLIGSLFGHGNGKVAMAAVGAGAGAIAGSRIGAQAGSSGPTYTTAMMPVQRCQQVNHYDVRTMYTVVYEFNGQRYSTKLPYNPGNTLRVNVSVVPQ